DGFRGPRRAGLRAAGRLTDGRGDRSSHRDHIVLEGAERPTVDRHPIAGPEGERRGGDDAGAGEEDRAVWQLEGHSEVRRQLLEVAPDPGGRRGALEDDPVVPTDRD